MPAGPPLAKEHDLTMLDFTHDASRGSWIASANGATEFPVQNLPYASASLAGGLRAACVGIGNQVLSLAALQDERVRAVHAPSPALIAAGVQSDLQGLMVLDRAQRIELRHVLSKLLGSEASDGVRSALQHYLFDIDAVRLELPVRIPNYTDFFASIHHATRVGQIFRPQAPLLPNYKYVPIGYHGRASTVCASRHDVTRPSGQVRQGVHGPVLVMPSAELDFEMELGFWIAQGSSIGVPVDIQHSRELIFGCSLLNDWSARDIQSWEYQPLGPFLSKNFMTTIAPWIVTAEALEPFRVPVHARGKDDPAPLPYLYDEQDQREGGFAIQLSTRLITPASRRAQLPAMALCSSNVRDLYWTAAQMIAHHTSGGCRMEPGDLLGSGTVSGPVVSESGSLLELTTAGRTPMALPSGEVRSFLEDGDEVVMTGRCEREGFRSIGFGEAVGVVRGARIQEPPR
jgi:fumarylacetoacetase